MNAIDSKNENSAGAWVKPMFAVSSLRSGPGLSELIHRLGHDIGNPLTAIISLGSVIQTVCETEQKLVSETKFSSYASSIIAEAWKVSRINERLVCMLSDRPGAPCSCNLEDSLSTVFTKLFNKDSARFANIDLEFAEDSQNLDANVDQAQLNLLLMELLLNAVEATERFPSIGNRSPQQENTNALIAIKITAEADLAYLAISSLNPTPTKTELAKLFEPFVSGYPEEKHLGLGLTTVLAIVERYHGRIAISEEKVGEAYRFTVKVGFPNH